MIAVAGEDAELRARGDLEGVDIFASEVSRVSANRGTDCAIGVVRGACDRFGEEGLSGPDWRAVGGFQLLAVR